VLLLIQVNKEGVKTEMHGNVNFEFDSDTKVITMLKSGVYIVSIGIDELTIKADDNCAETAIEVGCEDDI
jgi:hypothetical protein